LRKLSPCVMSAAILATGAAVDHRHRVIAGPTQQFRDHGADFACAYDNDVFHAASPILIAIFDRGPCEW
jgi:hypothetical protein